MKISTKDERLHAGLGIDDASLSFNLKKKGIAKYKNVFEVRNIKLPWEYYCHLQIGTK